jgi:hypothetical protein
LSSLFEDLKEASNNRHGSQYGETGIIVYLLKYLDIEPKYCVEFGAGMVHSGRKHKGTANIRYLYDKYESKCLYFDINKRVIDKSEFEYREQIKIETITASNVNDIFSKYEVPEDLDVLVIDVDGQDYWIWKSLNYNPKILLIEFNPSLSIEVDKVMHYDEDHYKWRNSNCLYYGASIGALKKLGIEKGYSLVYKTQRNLIFVNKEFMDVDISLKKLHPEPLKDLRDKYIEEQKWKEV